MFFLFGRERLRDSLKVHASTRHSHVYVRHFNGGNMRTTSVLFLFSLLISVPTFAADTFEMALPEEQQGSPTSGGFVDSFQKDLGSSKSSSKKSYGSSVPQQAPAVEEEEAPKGAYESAFTSYRSKKAADEEAVVDQNDAWKMGQDKTDNFDVENLSYNAPAGSKKSAKVQAKAPSKAQAKRAVSQQRAPASASIDEIPLPEGIEIPSELDRQPAAVHDAEVIPSAVSAKDRKAMIMQTISQNYPDLKTCYHDGLRRNSDMRGKVTMGWAMDPQGRVSGAEVQTSQLNNKQVEKCMVERLSNWRFPQQAKLQGSKDRMTYTFQFVPERD